MDPTADINAAILRLQLPAVQLHGEQYLSDMEMMFTQLANTVKAHLAESRTVRMEARREIDALHAAKDEFVRNSERQRLREIELNKREEELNKRQANLDQQHEEHKMLMEASKQYLNDQRHRVKRVHALPATAVVPRSKRTKPDVKDGKK